MRLRRYFPRFVAASAAKAFRQYSDLEGRYLQPLMARAGFEWRIAGADALEQFVDHLRAHVAKKIEYGQPLKPVHLKARAEPVLNKKQDRDFMPLR
jgi:hypothetical protein